MLKDRKATAAKAQEEENTNKGGDKDIMAEWEYA